MILQRRIPLRSIAGASVLFSILAVAGVRFLPSPFRLMSEMLALPGEMLWWSTLGGLFQGYPSGVLGIAVWIAGSAVFWCAVIAAVYWVGARIKRL